MKISQLEQRFQLPMKKRRPAFHVPAILGVAVGLHLLLFAFGVLPDVFQGATTEVFAVARNQVAQGSGAIHYQREIPLVAEFEADPGIVPAAAQVVETPLAVPISEPTTISIPKINTHVNIVSPQSDDLAVLDEALTRGVVLYPGSGLPGEVRNMFLFGHSSDYFVVNNSNYKAFNDLDTLTLGDVITIRTEDVEYQYEVFALRAADHRDTYVQFETVAEPMLTLSTCSTFSNLPTNRTIVEALLINHTPLNDVS